MNRRHIINQLSIIVVENDQMLDRVSDYDLMLYHYYYYYYICLGSSIDEVTVASTFLNKKYYLIF